MPVHYTRRMATLVRDVGRLENGAVMGRDEFHRLYTFRPELHRVELVEGVVYMPSPIIVEGHADAQALVLEWLAAYTLPRPELRHTGPGTVLLDDQNEPEPDAMLFRMREDRLQDGYLKGAPELIVEIANTSASRDVHQKKAAYERNAVGEYIVWRVADGAIDWFRLELGSYLLIAPGEDGIIESAQFPGLRLNVGAALAMDRATVVGAVRPE